MSTISPGHDAPPLRVPEFCLPKKQSLIHIIRCINKKESEELERELNSLRIKLAEKEIAAAQARQFEIFMAGFESTAQIADPEKYRSTTFCLKGGQRALPEEFLNDEQKASAERNGYLVVPFEELDRTGTECPNCHKFRHTVIYVHHQICDFPVGDGWELTTNLICIEPRITIAQISRQTSPNRMI